MIALKISTRAELEAALAKAGYAASSEFYDKNQPPAFSTECSAGTDLEEYHNAAAQLVLAAQKPIWDEWYLTPQGAEEKRLAEEAALEAENIAYELEKEKERLYLADLAVRRQAYAAKCGFENWSAYVAFIEPQIRYSYEHPWLAWVICRSDPEPPCSLELFNKYESERRRYR